MWIYYNPIQKAMNISCFLHKINVHLPTRARIFLYAEDFGVMGRKENPPEPVSPSGGMSWDRLLMMVILLHEDGN